LPEAGWHDFRCLLEGFKHAAGGLGAWMQGQIDRLSGQAKS
jgi:hypothetical protein